MLHSGFNYAPGSLKARFSTEGTRRMKEYCRGHGPIGGARVLVVARSDDEETRLDALAERAAKNGVETRILDREAIADREPHAAEQAALRCSEAASVDSRS